MIFWTLVAALVFSTLATDAMRRYALRHSVLDIPNERSSHSNPTPRGGGVAIVAAFLLGLLCFMVTGVLHGATAIALFGAGGLVAIVGFLDDHGHIAARWRLLAHFSAAVWGLVWLGGAPPLALPCGTVSLGWLGHGLAALYLVWLLNLYNFMDGIDGIAGVEAVTVGMGAAFLAFICLPDSPLWELPALLAACAGGFLLWNFPPAKIFMGDAGSGFLGLILGLLALIAARELPQLIWSWTILLGVFVVDATTTLLRRFFRGEKVYEAHRSHAYQHASRRFGAHRPVTLALGAINLFWLLPLAVAVARNWLDGATGLLIGYMPLLVLTLYFRAGENDRA